ncbi:MAG: hypothetical protein AAF228_03655 [Pseudomonadota bacterium]
MAVRSDPLTTIKLAAMAISTLILVGGGWFVYRRSTGLGPETLQIIGIIIFIPMIIVLAVNKALQPEVLATLCGGILGYVFGKSSSGGGR